MLSEREDILGNGIRLAAVGELDQLPPEVRGVLEPLCRESQPNDRMTLTLALSYGGQEEIASAARGLAKDYAEGRIALADIDAKALGERIPSQRVGEPDLIIRTGGETRLSNFLLFGSAYAELFFSDRLWPEFSDEDFFTAIASYQRRQRRFGQVVS